MNRRPYTVWIVLRAHGLRAPAVPRAEAGKSAGDRRPVRQARSAAAASSSITTQILANLARDKRAAARSPTVSSGGGGNHNERALSKWYRQMPLIECFSPSPPS